MGYQFQTNYPGFQPNYQQGQTMYQPQMQMQQPPVQNMSILYVEGDKGAEEFQMLPNTFAFLKSTDGKAVYFKQALANGMVSCEKYVRGKMDSPASIDNFVTRDEFEQMKAMVEQIKGGLSNE